MEDESTKLIWSVLQSHTKSTLRGAWCPSADVYRDRNGWLVKVDLAGVRNEDIQLSTTGRHLTIAGVRRDWSIQAGQQPYSMEIDYNRFERSVELPSNIENAQITTEYRDGMLLIRLQLESGLR